MSFDFRVVEGKEENDVRIVVSALAVSNGKLLFIKRGENPKRGYYSFPEGHLKAGEDPLQGLARECEEEVGCGVEAFGGKSLILEGPSNVALPDDYLERSWPPKGNRVGGHVYRVVETSSLRAEEPVEQMSKMYIYMPCKLAGEPRITSAALEVLFLTPQEVLELRAKRAIKVMPTTSVVLALIEAGFFEIAHLR